MPCCCILNAIFPFEKRRSSVWRRLHTLQNLCAPQASPLQVSTVQVYIAYIILNSAVYCVQARVLYFKRAGQNLHLRRVILLLYMKYSCTVSGQSMARATHPKYPKYCKPSYVFGPGLPCLHYHQIGSY